MHMHSKRHGFTLIELIVLIAVLGLALTGVTLAINHSAQQAPMALMQTRAMEIAQSYLEEILQKRFDQNTGQGGIPRCDSTDNNARTCSSTLGPDGETRATYNDVDDYNGISDSPPVTATGTSLTDYNGYRVQVSVVYAGNELGYSSNRHAKRITVTVTTPLGNTIPVSAYRVNY